MSQLIHAVSRVRAMESQLLTQNAVDRMISADSFEGAYSVLDDLGYAEESSYFRDTKDYEGVLEMGLFASSQIFKSFGLDSELQVLTVLWNIQNVLLFLKSKGKGESGDSIEKEIIPYGFYSVSELKNAIFNSEGKPELLSIISKAERETSLSDRDKLVETLFFESAQNAAKGNTFLESFLLKIQESELLKASFIEKDKEILISLFPSFSTIITASFAKKEKSEQITHLEILCDESMVQFLKTQSLGKIDGVEPLFSFFWRKERNARVIRSILLAKKAGISSEEIKSEFSSFIF